MPSRSNLLVSFVVLALATAGVACSDDTASSTPSVGGTGATGGSGSAEDSGPGGTGGADVDGSAGGTGGNGGSSASGGSGGNATGGDGGAGGSAATKYGYVTLVQSVLDIQGTEYVSHSISAGFVDSGIAAGDWVCALSEVGACTISDCTGATYDGGTPSMAYVSAGVLRIQAGATLVSITPGADGSYAPVTGQTRLWNAGQSLEVAADGDEAPSFSSTLVGVDPVLVTSPGFPAAGGAMNIQRSQDLVVGWSGGGAGKVFVQLARSVSSGATTQSVSATCAYEASAGAAVIPASVVSAIPAGESGSLLVSGGDRATVVTGDWSIAVQEYVPAVLSSGYAASAIATYE